MTKYNLVWGHLDRSSSDTRLWKKEVLTVSSRVHSVGMKIHKVSHKVHNTSVEEPYVELAKGSSRHED